MRKKILVVDDDIEMAELLRFNLKKAGFTIGTAFDGLKRLKKARSIKPDMILLDLMLPGLDGFALCEILRRGAATAAIPVVMITALQLGRLNGLDCGANDLCHKAVQPSAFDIANRTFDGHAEGSD
jgi:DNA-binding response OmpR family regulator